jgi:hypothetical protein
MSEVVAIPFTVLETSIDGVTFPPAEEIKGKGWKCYPRYNNQDLIIQFPIGESAFTFKAFVDESTGKKDWSTSMKLDPKLPNHGRFHKWLDGGATDILAKWAIANWTSTFGQKPAKEDNIRFTCIPIVKYSKNTEKNHLPTVPATIRKVYGPKDDQGKPLPITEEALDALGFYGTFLDCTDPKKPVAIQPGNIPAHSHYRITAQVSLNFFGGKPSFKFDVRKIEMFKRGSMVSVVTSNTAYPDEQMFYNPQVQLAQAELDPYEEAEALKAMEEAERKRAEEHKDDKGITKKQKK